MTQNSLLSTEIYVTDMKSNELLTLAYGSERVQEFHELVYKGGFISARKICYFFNRNYDIEFDGKELLKLIKLHYKNMYEMAKTCIKDEERYLLICLDMKD